MSLIEDSSLVEHAVFKPFRYPWAYEAWLTQQQIHWLPQEVLMSDDVKDWDKKLTAGERNLLTQIFRFFVQADVEVSNCYMKHYLRVFKPTEVQMMLSAFSNIETVHIAAYAHLLDTIGMPEVEYQAFLKYKQMKDKYDFLESHMRSDGPFNIALTLAIFGGFVEGVQLFASFVILMNFPRFNKMKGMGQIITWSVRDETLHTNSIIKLFRTLIEEYPHLWGADLKNKIIQACHEIIYHEDAFIDLAFEMGSIEGLEAEEVKKYIRFIANRRLLQLGLDKELFDVPSNPLPWVDEILGGIEHTNFFENRATEYSKAVTQGSWDEAFIIHDSVAGG